MDIRNKATSINLFSLKTPQMRAFHMSWFAFFLCFFAWFGIAPLMAVVREELDLTKAEIGNTIIASVAITIVARLVIGWLCDRIGPRLTYTWLLLIGSIPVMMIGLSHSYMSFMLFRLGIGVIGASFVITQYHTSVMFAPNIVGTANATSAGWGNLGGGVTQIVMPLIFALFVGAEFSDAISWRLAMVVAGGVCFLTGIAYFFFTTDFPDGNMKELRERGEYDPPEKTKGTFWLAAKDYRVWVLFVIYAACFGIELTINNIAAIYYMDEFGLGIKTAGLVAGLFGLMNIFARTTGGFISDRFVKKSGLRGRVKWLFIALLIEGIALIFFSQATVLALAIPLMIVFSLFVQMSEGATYSVVPFINKKALGSVAGIVGAGGNAGAVAAGFLVRSEGVSYQQALLYLGFMVCIVSFAVVVIRFKTNEEADAKEKLDAALVTRSKEYVSRRPIHEWVPGMRRVLPMDLLRVYLGIALVAKGVYFILNMASLESALGSNVGDSQELIAWSVVFAHVVGGSALALGIATRAAATVNSIILAGATVLTLSGGWESSFLANVDFQLSALVFFTLLLFIWRGSGPLSIDFFLRNGGDFVPKSYTKGKGVKYVNA